MSEKFKKREFVLEKEKEINPTLIITDYVKFQLTQDRVNLIEGFNEGEMLKVSFDIRGNKWEKNGETKYFTNLEAWRIEKQEAVEAGGGFQQAQAQAVPSFETPPGDPPPPPVAGGFDEELPF